MGPKGKKGGAADKKSGEVEREDPLQAVVSDSFARGFIVLGTDQASHRYWRILSRRDSIPSRSSDHGYAFHQDDIL
jgi:hypothetical protein